MNTNIKKLKNATNKNPIFAKIEFNGELIVACYKVSISNQDNGTDIARFIVIDNFGQDSQPIGSPITYVTKSKFNKEEKTQMEIEIIDTTNELLDKYNIALEKQ